MSPQITAAVVAVFGTLAGTLSGTGITAHLQAKRDRRQLAERRREEKRLVYVECLQVLHETSRQLADRTSDPDPLPAQILSEVERTLLNVQLVAPEPIGLYLHVSLLRARLVVSELRGPVSSGDRADIRREARNFVNGLSVVRLLRADLQGASDDDLEALVQELNAKRKKPKKGNEGPLRRAGAPSAEG